MDYDSATNDVQCLCISISTRCLPPPPSLSLSLYIYIYIYIYELTMPFSKMIIFKQTDTAIPHTHTLSFYQQMNNEMWTKLDLVPMNYNPFPCQSMVFISPYLISTPLTSKEKRRMQSANGLLLIVLLWNWATRQVGSCMCIRVYFHFCFKSQTKHTYPRIVKHK